MNNDAMSERMKAKFPKYVPQPRNDCTARPNTYNMLKAPKYKPPPVQSVRVGADDHLKFKSKGF